MGPTRQYHAIALGVNFLGHIPVLTNGWKQVGIK